MSAYDSPKGWRLPQDPNTQARICVKFKIPNKPEYRSAVRGAITELMKWNNWERDSERKAKIASQLFRETIGEYLSFGPCTDEDWDTEMQLHFMQDGCKIFYSYDSMNWLLMFDYELCFEKAGREGRGRDIIIFDAEIQRQLQELINKFNDTGARPDDGDIDPFFWDIATCLAVHAIIDAGIDQLLQRREQAEGDDFGAILFGSIFAAIGVAQGVFRIISWKVQVAVGMFAGAYAFLRFISRDEILNVPASEFSSLALRDELKNRMYEALKGVTPSLSTYQNSLDGVAPVTDNALQIRDWLRQGLNLNSFLAYLQMVRILHDFAKAEDFQENACSQLLWSHTFVFEGAQAHGWTDIDWGASFTPRNDSGTLTANGWDSIFMQDAGTGGHKFAIVTIQRDFTKTYIKDVTVNYVYDRGEFRFSTTELHEAWAWDGETLRTNPRLPTPRTSGEKSELFVIEWQVTRLRVRINSDYILKTNNTSPRGNAVITSVTVRGIGANPFI